MLVEGNGRYKLEVHCCFRNDSQITVDIIKKHIPKG